MKVFLTGFPGFIGRRLVRALADRHPDASFLLLVEGRLLSLAERRLSEAGLASRARLLVGDLTQPCLGISEAALLADVTHVWHLAAIYDIAAPRELSERVNVEGTRRVLEQCLAMPGLERLMYFSTCYVSGDRTGVFRESELDVGQGFKNNYDGTKFRAEQLVREHLDKLPITIVRPAIVVGDSRTGETDKYDGPYFMLQAAVNQPAWRPFPMVGSGHGPINLVPVDWVVAAAVALSENPAAKGETCQLADPNPPTMAHLVRRSLELLDRRPARFAIPPWLFASLMRSRAIRRFLRMPREFAAYTEHFVTYDTTNTTRLLAGAGPSCPTVDSYLPVMVAYVKANPKMPFLDGRTL